MIRLVIVGQSDALSVAGVLTLESLKAMLMGSLR